MERPMTSGMLFAVLASLACQPAEIGLTDADRDAIRASHDEWVTAMEAGNVEGLMALYTDDVVIMPPNMPALEGEAAARAWNEAGPTIAEAGAVVHEIEGQGDLAVVRGAYSLTFLVEGLPEPVHDTGKFIEVHRRQPDGSWRMTHDIFNSDLPLPALQ